MLFKRSLLSLSPLLLLPLLPLLFTAPVCARAPVWGVGDDGPVVEIPNCYRAWKLCDEEHFGAGNTKRKDPPIEPPKDAPFPAVDRMNIYHRIGPLKQGMMNISFDMEWRSPEERVYDTYIDENYPQTRWMWRDKWMRVMFGANSCIETWHCRLPCWDEIGHYAFQTHVPGIEDPIDIWPGNYCHGSDKYDDFDQYNEMWLRYKGQVWDVDLDCDVTYHTELYNHQGNDGTWGHMKIACPIMM